MTSTIRLHKTKKLLFPMKLIKNFRKRWVHQKIEETIRKYIPGYLLFWQTHYRSLFDQIYQTLQFWEEIYVQRLKGDSFPKKFKINSHYESYTKSKLRHKLIEFKIIECVAFWKGFIEIYGYYPPLISSQSFPSKSKIYSLAKGRSIAVIIPIGDIKEDYLRILQESLTVLCENCQIQQIFCFFDGISPSCDLNQWLNLHPKIKTQTLKQNVGPAKIRNIGIQMARENNISDVILIDADIHLNATILHRFLEFYCKSPFPIIFPLIKATGESVFDFYYDINGILNGRILYGRQDNEINATHLLYGTTSFVGINQVLFANHDLFCEDYKIAAGEDIDLCLQLIHQGVCLVGLDKIEINHYYGTINTVEQGIERFTQRFVRYGRGDAILLHKHPYFYDWLSKTTLRLSYSINP